MWSLLMQIIYTVQKPLFFNTTDLHSLDLNIWQNKYFMFVKVNIKNFSEYICRQLKHHQHSIRSEIGILLEIVLNAF